MHRYVLYLHEFCHRLAKEGEALMSIRSDLSSPFLEGSRCEARSY
jgi:hypothetical protein